MRRRVKTLCVAEWRNRDNEVIAETILKGDHSHHDSGEITDQDIVAIRSIVIEDLLRQPEVMALGLDIWNLKITSFEFEEVGV